MIKNRGFTLIELLVATSLLSLLMGAGLAALTAGTSAASKADRYNRMVSRGQAALQAMSRDIRAAVQHDNVYLVSLDREIEGLDVDTIDFITSIAPRMDPTDEEDLDNLENWRPTGRCEVGYYIDNNPDVESHWLLRREDGSIDEDPLEGGAVTMAGSYVSELNLQFYDGLFWQSGWDIEKRAQPVVVYIEIVVVDEDRIENPLTFSKSVPIMAR